MAKVTLDLLAASRVEFALKHLAERYFSFRGRLSRGPFYIRGLYLTLVAVVLVVASTPFFAAGEGLFWWLGLAIVAAAAAALLFGTISLIVRRLHDLGLSGYHAIWVGAAEFLSTILSLGPPRVVLMSLPLLAICAWVLLWPGTRQANRFGWQRA